MINLTYRFNINSSCLEISGIPDASNGDSQETIGIITSWTLKIIGSPLLEGEKEHLENLIQVILEYSRSYISGIRKTFISNKKIITISPFVNSHKLLLNSTKAGVKPLEIILDDSELSDLTRCIDLLIYDPRFNIKWDISKDKPFSKRYTMSFKSKYKRDFNFFYSFIIFLISSVLLLFIPTNNKYDIIDTSSTNKSSSDIQK